MVNTALLELTRKKKGLRMIDLAEHLGITLGAYSQKISGKRAFMVKDIIGLSQILNLGVEEILLIEKVVK